MIILTQGDQVALQLTAQDGSGNPIDITGASFTTTIKGMNGVVASFPNAQHSIVDAMNGVYQLALSSTDTPSLGLGIHKEILTQIVLGGVPVYYRGVDILEVLPPIPRQ